MGIIKKFNESNGMFDETGMNLMDKYFSTKTVYEIYDDQFNRLVNDVYGKRIEVESEEERLYESSLQFEILDRKVYEWDIKSMDRFKENGSYPGTTNLLTDMAKRGIIKFGNYIIVSGS